MSKHHVVIIGSGFGGLFAATALARPDVHVTLISRTSYHLFQPLLYQVATGILSEGEIAPSTREILARQRNVRVLLGLVEGVDVEKKRVMWRNMNEDFQTSYDTLIVAAGAGQSYFGNDQFEDFAPGMKTIDDALELRARIFNAFEIAEQEPDPVRRRELMTFVVVGAGPTGVEMAGQIRELSSTTLRREFRRIDPTRARVVLVDGAPHPLPAFGDNLGQHTARQLEHLGIELHMNTIVTDVTKDSVTLRDKHGNERVMPSICKVWAAGVAGAPIGRKIAERTGAEVDRAGRVKVAPDLTVPGYPDIFVIGDLMAVDGVPGVAQGAIQSGRYVAKLIADRLDGVAGDDYPPFTYVDKGSMATIARFKAVVSVKGVRLTGFAAWVAWCFLHLLYIVGFKSRVSTLLRWFVSFLSVSRSERTVTHQQMVARLALKRLGRRSSGRLFFGEDIDTLRPPEDD